jgi:hypothetical protein
MSCPDLMTTDQAANYFATLPRDQRGGCCDPAFFRDCGFVRYRKSDLDEYIAAPNAGGSS